MRKHILLIIAFIPVIFSYAQTKTEPLNDPDDRYGSRATKTTTVSKDENLNRKVEIVIKDNDGIVKERTTWVQDIFNNWTIKHEFLTPSGKVTCSSTWKFDANKKLVESKYTGYAGGPLHRVRTPEGTMKDVSGEKSDQSAASVKEAEEDFGESIKEMEEKTVPSLETPEKTVSCADGGCQTNFVVFAGPSVLISDYGTESETFFGGHVAALFNVSTHISVGLDASRHSKKFGTEHLTRSFIMAEGRYGFGDVTNCNLQFSGDVHVLVGLGTEKYASNDASGFAFGAGAAIEYNVSPRFGIKLQGDFLGVKFKDTDEINKNARVSLGAIIKLQRRNY